jgi:hypothetical protein
MDDLYEPREEELPDHLLTFSSVALYVLNRLFLIAFFLR